MKRMFKIGLAVLMVAGIVAFSLGAPIVITYTHSSGVLNTTYSNGTYTDIQFVGSADFSLTTTYNPTSVSRTFDIYDTLYYLQGGCAGPNPQPGNPDWGYFTTTAGDFWVHNEVEFQKRYNQYLPNAVHMTSSVDFTSGAVNIYNYCSAIGYRKLWHEVGQTGVYKDYVWESVDNVNQIVKMETTATLGGDAYFTGHGSYSPPTVHAFFSNAGGFDMTGDFNGVEITFSGGTYAATHFGTKGAGWYFDVDNP